MRASGLACAERALARAGRCLLACMLAAAACAPALAVARGASADGDAEAGEDAGTIIVRARLSDHNPFLPGTRRMEFPATTFLKGERLRVDFAGPAGERGSLIFDSATGQGWLVHLDDRIALPVDAAAVRGFTSLLVDGTDPCARIGPRCEPVPPRFIAGGSRKGYRFRSAAGRGPGGLSDGEFWVDGSLGVVLAYRGVGRTAKDASRMEADFLTVDDIAASYFELPESVDAYEVPARP